MLAASWGTPLIVQDKVYIGNEDGNMLIFKLSAEHQREPIAKVKCGAAIYTSPIVANNTLYIATRNRLMAIANGN